MVVQSLEDWCKKAPICDVLMKPQAQSSTCISLSNPAAQIFLEIRTTLSVIFHANSYFEDLSNTKVEATIMGRTPVFSVHFPEIMTVEDEEKDVEGMKKNVLQLCKMAGLVFHRATELDVSVKVKDTNLSFFYRAFREVVSATPKTFKTNCFALFTHPLLYSTEERFNFVNKIYRLSKKDEELYRMMVSMDKGIKNMSNWAKRAHYSGNEAVKSSITFQSYLDYEGQDPYDANWRIGPFLRNAIQHIGKLNTTVMAVLEELESLYPHILCKLHLQLWGSLAEVKNDEVELRVINHFKEHPGSFGFYM